MGKRNGQMTDKPCLATVVAELFPRQGQWRAHHYFALPEVNRIVELSQGELIIPAMPTNFHQAILDALYAAMRAFVHTRRLGVIRFSSLPVQLWRDTYREPDILFVTNAHRNRIHEQYWDAPDLAVEVISPFTVKTDRVDKFKEYQRAGIGEYWLVDPEAFTIEVFVLKNKRYTQLGKWGMGDKARSKMLKGFTVKVAEVFAAE
jgi:Uma2 family endonuclease